MLDGSILYSLYEKRPRIFAVGANFRITAKYFEYWMIGLED